MGGFMKTFFLGKEYVALLLIRAKEQFLEESFITISELNQFDYFLQQEFNNRNLDIVITSNTLSSEDFNTMGEAIMTSNTCCFDLNLLPLNVLTVLYDANLIADFLIQLENKKLEMLEGKKEEAGPKLYKK